MEEDDPKFSCDACGTEFRWKPEIVGKKARCKCGATVVVPEHPTLTPVSDESADADDGGEGEYDVIEPPPKPVVPMQQTVAPNQGLPPTAVATASGVVDRKRCPVCGVPGLATAPICINCGFNFITGRPPKDRGAEAAEAEKYQQAARAAWAAPSIAIFLLCCAGGASRGSPAAGLCVLVFQLLLIGAGVGCAIYALTGVKRVGKEGIAVPAVVGLFLNALFVLFILMLVVLVATGTIRPDPPGGKSNKAPPGRRPVRMAPM